MPQKMWSLFKGNQIVRNVLAQRTVFTLGGNRVRDRLYYYHAGVISCVKANGHVRKDVESHGCGAEYVHQ